MEICAFVEPQQGASYEDLRSFATTAERLGFDGFFRSDHYLPMGSAFDGLPGVSDAWTTLAALARDTDRIRLGTLVSSVTFRAPGILAIQVANVDDMSGGRVELGLGAGWYQAEHEAYGIPFPDHRFDLLEEQLQIIRGLWSVPAGGTFDFDGAHYWLHGAPALQRPTQPRIPVIVGGAGPKRTPQLAARYASEFNSFRGPVAAGQRFEVIRAACTDEGRDPASLRYSAAIQVIAGTTDAEVASRARRLGHDPASVLASDDIAAGTPQQLVDHLSRYRETGAVRLYLQCLDPRDLEMLELIGAEVLPHLRAEDAAT